MATNKVIIDVTKWPEALAMIRKELANYLRDEADAEADPRIARRLRKIAAVFETGCRE